MEVQQEVAQDYFILSYLFALAAIKQQAKANFAIHLSFTIPQIDLNFNFVFINQTIGLFTLKLAKYTIKVAITLRFVVVKAVIHQAN